MTCPLMKGGPGVCHWCGGELTGRRRKWCSDECSRANWNHHDWNAARRNALERDNWTCVRCGFIGWRDVPASVLRILSDDRDELHPFGTVREDWAVALGLLDPKDANASIMNVNADQRRRRALDQLPESVNELIASERRGWDPIRSRRRYRPGGHQLEVNHITPREGKGYGWGCHHHPENLETLCRPCHVEETTRQRRGLPSWREDPRPLAEIELDGTLLEVT